MSGKPTEYATTVSEIAAVDYILEREEMIGGVNIEKGGQIGRFRLILHTEMALDKEETQMVHDIMADQIAKLIEPLLDRGPFKMNSTASNNTKKLSVEAVGELNKSLEELETCEKLFRHGLTDTPHIRRLETAESEMLYYLNKYRYELIETANRNCQLQGIS